MNSVNGGAPPSWVTPNPLTVTLNSGNCSTSGGTKTCTITVPAPPGSVNYTFAVGDGTHVLATSTQTFTIVQGSNNATLSATLQGVVATVSISASLAASTTATGTASTPTLTVSAFDADGNAIVNGTSPAAYSNPITLTDNDASGATSLSVNGSAGAASVVVSAPTDSVVIKYSGAAINPFTITAGGTGISGGGTITPALNNLTFTGTTVDTLSAADPNYNQPTVYFGTIGATASVSAAELGFTNAPYNQSFASIALDPTTCGSGAGAVATVSAGPATAFTITAKNSGICKASFVDNLSTAHTTSFYISVTTASFGLN